MSKRSFLTARESGSSETVREIGLFRVENAERKFGATEALAPHLTYDIFIWFGGSRGNGNCAAEPRGMIINSVQ